MTHEMPPLPAPSDMAAVSTPAELRSVWCALMGELAFTDRRLWLLFLTRDRRPAGPLLSIDDLADGPWDLPVEDLVTICREILDGPGGGGSVAMLLTRPGGDPWHVGDRAWARYLTAASHRIGGRVWPVHRAHDHELVPLTGDSDGGTRTA